MQYTLKTGKVEAFEVFALHKDGREWVDFTTGRVGMFLRRSGERFILDTYGFNYGPQKFFSRETAIKAWNACADVFNDTIPDIRPCP